MTRVLITGGAGFVGSSLAVSFKEAYPTWSITAFDSLHRRGSELNVSRLRKLGIEFLHGDIRVSKDLEEIPGNVDVLIDASAEPSVGAGISGSSSVVLDTNLVGTLNCLQAFRRRVKIFVFLSTSRVYSIGPLRDLRLREGKTRFHMDAEQAVEGAGQHGIAETFRVDLPRSLYGATKLASEIVIQEFAEYLGLQAVINRCGVIAGPGQFGKVDQGVFTLWAANHFFNLPLKYIGFGGLGKQVRDLLHPLDLFSLVVKQLEGIDRCSGQVFNVGGGMDLSTSLIEFTALCREVTGNQPAILPVSETSIVDVPFYVSDCRKVRGSFDWKPQYSLRDIVVGTVEWIRCDSARLRELFGG